MKSKIGAVFAVIFTLLIGTLGDNRITGTVNAAASNDSLARLYEETGNETYFDEIMLSQNEDGGFGLTEQYQSDVLDTLLVYEALVHRNAMDAEHSDVINRIIGYMLIHQNEDGGFSYTSRMESDDLLTLKAAVITLAYERFGTGYEENSLVEAAKQFVELKEYDFSRDNFIKKLYQEMYYAMKNDEYEPDAVLTELKKIRDSEGRYYENDEATKTADKYIKLIEELQRPYLAINEVETVLSSYTVYAGVENTINVVSDITYKTNNEYQAKLLVKLMCDDKVISEKTVPIIMNKGNNSVKGECSIVFEADKACSYQIVTELWSEDRVISSQTDKIKVNKIETDDLVLAEPVNTDNGVKLIWNDISNDFYRYGYRVYRMTDEGQWETRSSWDGLEKVKVLNIYPCEEARNHLKNWMTSNLDGEETAAGKGLFEIDVVNIDDYNRTPEKYLTDENGNYKYDVLFFGAYNRNAEKDLNELSYNVTQEFVNSGRGVLFGHDTVTLADTVKHTYFARFAEQLGIKLKPIAGWELNTKVKVVNSGMITSYPWKIEGELNIPTTHCYQQYSGGSLPGTVWMKFPRGAYVDRETGATADAYLCSRNQLALIQTGNSNGKATDDERKVLANTLFYLKQLSYDTQLIDPAAYDTNAPGICQIGDAFWSDEGLRLEVKAEDEGTTYKYYIEAAPQRGDAEDMKKISNIVETVSVFGVEKYEYYISESEVVTDKAQWNCAIADGENSIMIDPGEIYEDKDYYIHIRAVDYSENTGEAAAVPMPKQQKPEASECALFGSESIVIYCNELKCTDVYSGGDFTFAGSALAVDGKCEAVGRINAYTGNAAFTEKTEEAENRAMPQLHEMITAKLNDAKEADVLNIYNSTTIDKPTYCNTTTGAYCPELIMSEMLICENAINMGAGSVNCNTLYSVNGDININASILSGNGVIYAPNGTVNINVSELKYTGKIIAKRINIQGSYITVEKE